MSEQNLISPLLDNLIVGEPFCSRSGIRTCPAMNKETEGKYIVKIISTPATPSQLDAMLLSGAFPDADTALQYFEELAAGIEKETAILEKLSSLEGFLPISGVQTAAAADNTGYETYLLSPYRRTLERRMRKEQLTHLAAINLGLDMCSALAVCRRSGYLYAALKPENIIVTDEGSYKIGDIGFIAMDSLQYASMPDRYRSQYTAPEIADAFSCLNATIDIYALGLILYRIFNGGNLPSAEDLQQLPAPDYADYEMSEIILKACAFEPSERWQDPVELGQALVAYMQRNGANDTPIIPLSAESTANDALDEPSSDIPSPEACDTDDESSDLTSNDAPQTDETVPQEDSCATENNATDISVYGEDPSGNLTFLSDDEDISADELAQMEYDTVSEDLSEILSQADELISHEAPTPVIPPEPVEISIPEAQSPECLEDSEQTEDHTTSDDSERTAEDAQSIDTANSDEADITEVTDDTSDSTDAEAPQVRKKSHWLRNTLLGLLVLVLIAAGVYFYKNYYIQPIDGLNLHGSEDTLFVYVSSNLDESSLSVVCSDIYGNQLTKDVTGGKAVFTDLSPNSVYTVTVEARGFHKLTGQTTDTYTTPDRTEIVQFSAVTGSEDGSVILGFTIEGKDSDQWIISYSTPGEAAKSLEFSGHVASINGLTVGSTYTFELSPVTEMYISGTNEITHTASTLVLSEDLRITGCINGTLSVAWSAPENTAVSSWTVHCYNDNGYDKTVITENTTATFADVVDTDTYTVEVTAAGMSVSQRVNIESNSLTILNFSVDESNPNYLSVHWEQPAQPAQESFILQYSVDGSPVQEVLCTENSAMISPKVPGSTYRFHLKTADGVTVLGGSEKFTTAPATEFNGYGVTYDKLQFMMCKTPAYSDWNRYYLDDSDYTTNFTVDEKASFLVKILSEYDTSWDEISILYVIRDAERNIISAETDVSYWTNMWYRSYGEFDIPSLPATPGNYSVSVYFNGALAGNTDFTVSN